LEGCLLHENDKGVCVYVLGYCVVVNEGVVTAGGEQWHRGGGVEHMPTNAAWLSFSVGERQTLALD
jgi:hypothetical protein